MKMRSAAETTRVQGTPSTDLGKKVKNDAIFFSVKNKTDAVLLYVFSALIISASLVGETEGCAAQVHERFCDLQADSAWSQWTEWDVEREGCRCGYDVYEMTLFRVRER